MRIKRWKKQLTGVDSLDFPPGSLRIQVQPPTPFLRTLLYIFLTLLGLLFVWAAFGKLAVVTSAEGKLIPQSYLKIVQPSEQGVIRDILVEEGQRVKAGQVLMRMDTTLSETDVAALSTDTDGKRITLRRIDAELSGRPFSYRALVDLKAQHLIADGVRHNLTPGMQVTADNMPHRCLLRCRLTCGSKLNAKRGRSHIYLGARTILEYLLSPVLGAFQEAGRER